MLRKRVVSALTAGTAASRSAAVEVIEVPDATEHIQRFQIAYCRMMWTSM
jgi:hypothetical protein